MTIPEKIWVGFLGGSRFWGDVTEDTHPDNQQYTRDDIADRNARIAAVAEEVIPFLESLQTDICMGVEDTVVDWDKAAEDLIAKLKAAMEGKTND